MQRALQHADIECAGSLVYVPLSTVEVSAEHEADAAREREEMAHRVSSLTQQAAREGAARPEN